MFVGHVMMWFACGHGADWMAVLHVRRRRWWIWMRTWCAGLCDEQGVCVACGGGTGAADVCSRWVCEMDGYGMEEDVGNGVVDGPHCCQSLISSDEWKQAAHSFIIDPLAPDQTVESSQK